MGEEPALPLFGLARTWTSRTPYGAPWHGNSFQDHVRKELILLKLVTREEAQHVTVESVRQLRTSDRSAIDLVRTEDKPPPMPPLAGFLQLDVAMPVQGPIILGYGSHFGLGQFVNQP
jgi:CRISPR-associated protein Csb2